MCDGDAWLLNKLLEERNPRLSELLAEHQIDEQRRANDGQRRRSEYVEAMEYARREARNR